MGAVKRIFDITGAIVALISLSPVWIIITLAIESPLFFNQERCGKDLKRFNLIRFRTMVVGNHKIETIKDDYRVTRIGRFLRSTGLDSIPELINVLKGDMSLVGPRPMPYLVADEDEYQNIEQVPGCAYRHTVRPGITGLAQLYVNKQDSRRIKYQADCWYIAHWSLWLDIKIILLSFKFAINKEWDLAK